jgi:hypothetical protein
MMSAPLLAADHRLSRLDQDAAADAVRRRISSIALSTSSFFVIEVLHTFSVAYGSNSHTAGFSYEPFTRRKIAGASGCERSDHWLSSASVLPGAPKTSRNFAWI